MCRKPAKWWLGAVTLVGNGQTLEFTPTSPWQYGELVEVFLDATATDHQRQHGDGLPGYVHDGGQSGFDGTCVGELPARPTARRVFR